MSRVSPLAVEEHFELLYEDEDVAVVNKAAPLLTHPAQLVHEASLWQGLQQLYCYDLAVGRSLSLINRLDRETSGIVLVAKHHEAASFLGRAMQQRLMKKSYLALVHGQPAWYYTSCREGILRMGDVAESEVRVRQCCHALGKYCHTDFELLARISERQGWPAMSLLSCLPHTGRMHQIRVHLEHLGHPIVGDKIYSTNGEGYLDFIKEGWTLELEQRLILPRHALHASRLEFPHPRTEKMLCVECPLPPDLLALLPEQVGESSTAHHHAKAGGDMRD